MAENGTSLGRGPARDIARKKPRGASRFHPVLEERLNRYVGEPAVAELVPATMHTVARLLGGAEPATVVEHRMARALVSLGDDAAIVETMVGRYQDLLDNELAARVLSSGLASWPDEIPIPDSVIDKIGGKDRSGCCCCEEDEGRPTPPTPPPDDYRLTFSHLYCVDESDPEFWGSDEPYVVFAGITEEMVLASQSAWSARSPVYGDVDDGDRRPSAGEEGTQLYGPVAARPVTSPVLITATCFEHDNGDPDTMADELRAALTTVATTAAGVGGPVGWIVAGAAAIGVGITFLVDLWAADDPISDARSFAFTEADAAALTATTNPTIVSPLHFDGGDANGIYDAYLKLQRVV